MIKSVSTKKKSKKAKKTKSGRREPSVNSMRKAVMGLLDKLQFEHAVVRDHRHLIVVTNPDRPPFTINLTNGKVEDIDINKGNKGGQMETGGVAGDAGSPTPDQQ